MSTTAFSPLFCFFFFFFHFFFLPSNMHELCVESRAIFLPCFLSFWSAGSSYSHACVYETFWAAAMWHKLAWMNRLQLPFLPPFFAIIIVVKWYSRASHYVPWSMCTICIGCTWNEHHFDYLALSLALAPIPCRISRSSQRHEKKVTFCFCHLARIRCRFTLALI